MSYRHKLNILIESFYKEVEKLRDAVIQVSDLLFIFFSNGTELTAYTGLHLLGRCSALNNNNNNNNTTMISMAP